MTDAPVRPRRRSLVVAGSALVAAACLLGAWILLLRGNDPFAVDAAWNSWITTWHAPTVTSFAYVMGWLGGGWFGVFAVPIGAAVVLLILRRPWAAAYFVAAEAASALLVQILKHVFGRARPEDILIITDFGSFPSGHTANAATLAVALFVLFPRVWVAVLGGVWVVLMAFARTVLHAHWLSDTLGGALVGAGSALLLAAIFAAPLGGELRRRADAVGVVDDRDAVDRGPSLG